MKFIGKIGEVGKKVFGIDNHNKLIELLPNEFKDLELKLLQSKYANCRPMLDALSNEVFGGHVKRFAEINDLLHNTKYVLVLVGVPGAGKTTLINTLLNDISKPKTLDDISLFTVAGGNTTAAEVHIKIEDNLETPRIGIVPIGQEKYKSIIEDYTKTIWDEMKINEKDSEEDGKSDSESESEFEPTFSAEVEKIIRHQAGVKKHSEILECANGVSDYDEFLDIIEQRINNGSRTVTELICPDGFDTVRAKKWFRDAFKAVNYGDNEQVSLPEQIICYLPRKWCKNLPVCIDEIVDTRGLSEMVRDDIKAHLRTPNAIVLFINDNGKSVNQPITNILRGWIAPTETDIINRIAILINDQNGTIHDEIDSQNEDEYLQNQLDKFKEHFVRCRANFSRSNLRIVNLHNGLTVRTNKTIDAEKNIRSDVNIAVNNFLVAVINSFRTNLIAEAVNIYDKCDKLFQGNQTNYPEDARRFLSFLTPRFDGVIKEIAEDKKHPEECSVSEMFRRFRRIFRWNTVKAAVRRYGNFEPSVNFYSEIAQNGRNFSEPLLCKYSSEIFPAEIVLPEQDKQLVEDFLEVQKKETDTLLRTLEILGGDGLRQFFGYSAQEVEEGAYVPSDTLKWEILMECEGGKGYFDRLTGLLCYFGKEADEQMAVVGPIFSAITNHFMAMKQKIEAIAAAEPVRAG